MGCDKNEVVGLWGYMVRICIYKYESALHRLTIGDIDSMSRRLYPDVRGFKFFEHVGEYYLLDSCLELTNLSWAEEYVRGIGQVVPDYVSGYRPYMTRNIWGLILLGIYKSVAYRNSPN